MNIDFTCIDKLHRPNNESTIPDPFSLESNSLNKERQERRQMQAVYKTYNANKRNAEQYKAAILKGVKNGTPERELLLNAAKCISLLTSDPTFSEHVAADLELLQELQAGEPLTAGQDVLHALELMKRQIEAALKEYH